MWPYLRNKFQYVENLNELQNMGYTWIDDGNRIHCSFDKNNTVPFKKKLQKTEKAIVNERRNRYRLLKKYGEQDYFLKLFPETDFQAESWNFLLENYHFIFLERRNVKEQLLSLFLASKTEVWNIDQKELEYSTYEFTEKDKASFLEIFSLYKTMKEFIINNGTPYSIIYHEDIISYDPIYKALELFDFTDWKDYIDLDKEYLPAPMGSGDKRKYVSNFEEFETWFNEHF